MKKAKIMLTSIAVLAVVGGALAFKAKTVFSNDYCVTTTTANGGKCAIELLDQKLGAGTNTFYYYTTEPATGCPTAGINCIVTSTKLTNE